MTATFYVGDALRVLATLPENSVDLVLTSPPFLALRSYLPADHPDKALEGGSQSTPGAYIDWLLDVVEACNRVLAPHGSICVELGDTYSGSGGGGGDYLEGGWREGQAQFAGSAASMKESNAAHWRQKNGQKQAWPLAKSLTLIPESFRFAMVYGFNPFTGRQTERWRLRNVIRWVRPNPPVGALGDKFRPATSELMVFCKSAKRYFDLDAVRTEPHPRSVERYRYDITVGKMAEGRIAGSGGDTTNPLGPDKRIAPNPAGAPPLDWWQIEEERFAPSKGSEDSKDQSVLGIPQEEGAPPLDWWNIPPGGYEGAHYAVMPKELCVKPIKAMCPESVCKTCGVPRRRIVDTGEVLGRGRSNRIQAKQEVIGEANRNGRIDVPSFATRITMGFTDCGHDHWRNGLVLDPFAGSGTTLAVASGYGRDSIGIDLDERNYDLALERVGPLVLQRGEVVA